MPQCPQCNKNLVQLSRKCPSCMADLDLLVEYVNHLQVGLDQAESLTRAGELGRAVWAYLAVLEVDPDNEIARRQVGQVATAVRQFDRASPGRRWLYRMRGELPEGEESPLVRWLRIGAVVLLIVAAFGLGYSWANHSAGDNDTTPPTPPPQIAPKQPATLG